MAFNFSISFGKEKKSQDFKPTDLATTDVATGISISNALSLFNNSQTALVFGYANIPEFAAPINYVIDKSIDIPVHHQIFKAGKWERVINSDIEKLLKNPNQFQTGIEYAKDFYLNKILTGEVFDNPLTPIGFSKPSKLFIFQSNMVKIDWENGMQQDFRMKEIKGYNYNFIHLSPEDMHYRKEVNQLSSPDKRGVSRLTCLANTSKSLQAGSEANIITKQNRGAEGIISPTNENVILQPKDVENIQKKYNQRAGITGGKSPHLIVGKALSYVNTSIDVKKMGLSESRLIDFRNVCGVLKFSSQLLNDVSASTYNNLKIIEKQFYINAVKPEVEFFCQFHNQMFKFDTNKERLTPDFSQIEALQVDRKINNDIASQQYQDGVITGDEYRISDGKTEDNLGYKIESNGQYN